MCRSEVFERDGHRGLVRKVQRMLGRKLRKFISRDGKYWTWVLIEIGSQSFFDFDAYRNMLSGEPSALYEGQFGEQSQVWKMREVYVRPTGATGSSSTPTPRRPPARTAQSGFSEVSEDSTADSATSETPASMSAALNAGFTPLTSAFDRIVPMLPNQGRMHSSSMTTNAVVNLLERNPTDEHLVAMLGGLEGYEMVPQQEVERIIRRRTEGDENGDPVNEGDDLEIMLLGTVSTSSSSGLSGQG